MSPLLNKVITSTEKNNEEFNNFIKNNKDSKVLVIKEYRKLFGKSILESKQIVEKILRDIVQTKCLNCNADTFESNLTCEQCGCSVEDSTKLNEKRIQANQSTQSINIEVTDFQEISRIESASYKDKSIKCPLWY